MTWSRYTECSDGAADIVADRIHLRGAAVADDGHAAFRVLGGNGSGEHQIGGARRRVGRVLVPGSTAATPNRWAEIDALDVEHRPGGLRAPRRSAPAGGTSRACRRAAKTAIRASSTAMSAASTNDTSLGPLACKRDSHSLCARIKHVSSRPSSVASDRQSYGLPAWPLKHLFLLVKVK